MGWPITPLYCQDSILFFNRRQGLWSGKDFEMNIQDLIINNGAEMIVAIAGDILRMPGLPKTPQAKFMDIKDGVITGLS